MAQYIGNTLDTTFLKTKRQTYTYTAAGGQTVFQGLDTYGSTFVSIAQGQVLVYENGLLKEPHSYTVYSNRIEYTSGGADSGATVVIITEVESALTSAFTRAETVNLLTETSLGAFSDINITSIPPTNGETLVWDGAQFVPGLAFDSASFDTAFGLKTTTDLSEGSKLYYTNARVQTYLDDNFYATETYVGLQISSLVDSAPGLLDTLNELAAALGDDPNFATTITTALDSKYDSADFNTDFTTRFGLKSTSDLSEGTNQYYTTGRVDDRIALASLGDLSDVDITTVVPTVGQALIWDSVNNAFVPGDSFSQSDFDSAFGAKTTDNLNLGTVNLFYTEARVNANIAAKTTDDLTEGSALYYTEARVNANIAAKTTDDLAEGNNLYYTNTRVATYLTTTSYATESFVNSNFASKTTDDLTEGTKLYYTDTRVATYLANGNYATQAYVGEQFDLLVDAAPGTLNTLNELAAALGDDANFSTTLTNSIALKANISDLGTASAEDVGYFATAAQGALAGSALQSVTFSDLGITDGTIGQILTTDGTGGVTFEDAAEPLIVSGTAPSSPTEGALWFDNVSTGQLYAYVGSVWLSTAGISTLEFSSVGDLSDVDLTTTAPTVGQALVWDNGNGKFVPGDVAVDFTGYATETFVNNAISTASGDYATAAQGTLADSAIQSLTGYATEAYVGQQFDLLIDAAPGTLDTLNELAAALGDDANFSTTVTNSIALKANSADLGTAAAQDVGYFATASQGALADSAIQSLTGYATEVFVNTAVSNIIDSAPGVLDTLNEIATALGGDANFSTTISSSIALKANSADLGTAAAQDVGYFATSAQGALADSALQSVTFADLGVTDGTVGQILTTDGVGGITFEDAPIGGATVSGTNPVAPEQGALWFDNTNSGQLYAYVGSVWLSTAGISTLEFSSVGDLSDVDLTSVAPTAGQALVWDNVNSKFIPGDVGADFSGYATETFVNTAISTASSNYATSAQGALADSALQSVAFADLTTTPTTLVGYGITNAATSAQGALADSAIQSLTGYATEAYVSQQFDILIDSSPGALNTLNELAAALGDDENFSVTVTNSIALKANIADLGTAAAQDVGFFATAAQGSLADSALQSVAFADLTATPTTLVGYGITDAATTAQGALADSALQSVTNDDINWIPYSNLVDLPSATDNHGMFAHVHGTGKAYFAHAGAWVELANTSDLGTAASQNIGYFATSAQGALADSALQSVAFADLTVTPTTLAGYGITDSFFDGAYSSLSGAPTIPSALTDLSIVDGTVGQLLSTDGLGNFTFIDAAAGGSNVSVSGTAPTSPNEGDLWYDDTNTGQLYVYENGFWTSTGIPPSIGSINDLGDVDIVTNAPTNGQSLIWDNANSKFVPGDVAGGGGVSSIDDLSDVDITSVAPTDGQSLIWDNANSKFVPGDVAAGGASITTSETAPATPAAGDMWFNSATLALYLYYADGDSTQWIQINDAGGAAGNGLVLISSTPPANPASGDLWYDDGSTGSLLIYNGSVWVSTADGGGGGGDQSTYWVEATTTYDAVAGSKIFADTSSSAVLINLPTSPAMGDEVYIVDASGNSGTYNITVTRGGSKITGFDEDLTIGVNNAAVQLAYYNATRGWIIISK